MRLHLCRTLAAMALTVLTGAAFADVKVSQSNTPTSLMGEQFASLFGAEHTTVNALPQVKLAALAKGPDGESGTDPATLPSYTDAWLATLSAPTGDQEWDCLRRALYFEARGEGVQGEFAVAEVILNRVDSAAFPNTVCGVVHSETASTCAFSYICDGLSDQMRDPEAEDRAGRIARVMLDGAPRALTKGATFFHARWSRPSWGKVVETASIGGHLFYRMAS